MPSSAASTGLFLAGTFVDGVFSLGATFSKATPMYELVFVAFQATFAAITCCLILGSLVERIKFSAVLLFVVIWFTFSYIPVAHMVWFWAGPDAYTTLTCRWTDELVRPATSGSGVRSISQAAPSCTSTRVWRVSSARSCSASGWVTARSR